MADPALPGSPQHITRPFRGGDIAIGHHRDAQCGLDRSDGIVLGQAFVTLLARATVDSEHLDTYRLRGQRDGERIFIALTPTGAHFQRDGHVVRLAGFHYGIDDFNRQAFVLHQRRARPLVADLLGRATHVDVNDLRAMINIKYRRLGHHLRIGTSDLHGNWGGLAVMVGAA
jgi:hypothetical protein